MIEDFLYKIYDIPNFEKIQNIIWNNIEDRYKKLNIYYSCNLDIMKKCSALVEAIDSFHSWQDIYNIGMIIAQPNSALPIHTDYGFPLVQNKYSFNIPIKNTEDTDTIFYKLKQGEKPKLVTSSHGDPYLKYEETDVEEIERFTCTKPCFFNTQIPHRVSNSLDSVRVLMTVRCRTPFNFKEIFNLL